LSAQNALNGNAGFLQFYNTGNGCFLFKCVYLMEN